MSSSNFVDKAPAKVVDGVRQEQAEAQEQLRLIQERIAQMEALLAKA